MGIGSIEEARDMARQYRVAVNSGVERILDRQALRGQHTYFREAAFQAHELTVPSWRNYEHASQCLSSL